MQKFTRLIFTSKILVCVLLSAASAQEIKFSGYGATGFRFYERDILNKYNQETYYEGKIQMELEMSKHIEAQLDLRGNSNDNSVQFREFSVKFDYDDYFRVKVGNIKRPFGAEQLQSRENLITVERSRIQNSVSEIGYGGRSVSLMVYSKYSKKRPEFPYSYYLSLFRNNSLNSGIAVRGLYHFTHFQTGFSYIFQTLGGWRSFGAHGIGAELAYEKAGYDAVFEIYYVQDPVKGKLIDEQNRARSGSGLSPMDDQIYGTGFKVIAAKIYDIDGRVIKMVQPVVMFSAYIPDTDMSKSHALQALLGTNLYFTKKVRFRFNADIRMTKTEFSENNEYSTDDSRAVAEIQVKF